jgi:hypothetical protein
MPQLMFPNYILDDLQTFISENYRIHLPHSLLIAQAFCLKFTEYGRSFGVSAISDAVDYVRTNHQ